MHLGAALVLAFALTGCARGRDPLVLAVIYRSESMATALLAAGADPNVCDELPGFTISPLAQAAVFGDVAMIDLLLHAGARVDQPCSSPPLDYAIANKRVAAVKRLIEAGADVTAVNEAGVTYVMLATLAAKAELIPILVAAGAPVNARRTDTGDTALITAATWDLQSTRALLAAGADIHARNHAGETALMAAQRAAASGADKVETTPGRFTRDIIDVLQRASSGVAR